MSDCNCISEANAFLAEHNTVVVTTFYPVVRPILETEKIDTKKRGRPKLLVATFCPMCGHKYEGKP